VNSDPGDESFLVVDSVLGREVAIGTEASVDVGCDEPAPQPATTTATAKGLT
jgi:hypothetical protein